jgi:hypothetical protein
MRFIRRVTRGSSGPPRAIARLSGAVALVVLAALLVAGCGGGSDASGVAVADDGGGGGSTTSTTSTSEVSADPEEARLQFAQCMRDQGLDFPDPQPSSGGGVMFQRPSGEIDQEAFRKGAEACQEFLGDARGQLADPDDPAIQDAQLEFAECMRDEGVDVPDPQSGQGPGGGGAQIDMDDPAVAAALDKCGSIIQDVIGDRRDDQ